MNPSSPSLVVATYNIRLGIQRGLAAAVDVLGACAAPDIIAVQEVGRHWLMGPEGDSLARLAELLELPHSAFAPTIEEIRLKGPPARYGHALFSRWPFKRVQTVELPRCEDEPRALLHCIVDSPHCAIEMISTHLSHRSSDRPEQGRFLHRWLKSRDDGAIPSFLLGDLNAPRSESWLASLIQHWHDADADQHRPTFPSHAPERRIDYVLASEAELSTVVVPDTRAAQQASDHRPVITRWHLPIS